MQARALAAAIQFFGLVCVGIALSVIGWWAVLLWAGIVLFLAGWQLERKLGMPATLAELEEEGL